MGIEAEREDLLHNIEFVVARFHRMYPAMTDYAVLRTYEALAQNYSAEVAGRSAFAPTAEGAEAEMLQAVKQMCEWRLGRGPELRLEEPAPECDPFDVPTLVLCLKRLIKSVKFWTKEGGRQGYLNFIDDFIE